MEEINYSVSPVGVPSFGSGLARGSARPAPRAVPVVTMWRSAFCFACSVGCTCCTTAQLELFCFNFQD